jgi:maltose alpha-D-glucosyltransferase/alpha-amylase
MDANGGSWHELIRREAEGDIAAALLRYVSGRRWFRGKARTVKEAHVLDRVPLGAGADASILTLLEVEYVEGAAETYCVPLGFFAGEEAERREQRAPHALIARVDSVAGGAGVETRAGALFDTFATADAVWPLLEANGVHGERGGELRAESQGVLKTKLGLQPRPPVKAPELDQTNTVVFVGDSVMLKLYRQVEEGINPELEVGAVLASRMGTQRLVPAMLGSVSYQRGGRQPSVLGVAQELVANEGDAWKLTLAEIEIYFERVLSQQAAPPPPPSGGFCARARTPVPSLMTELGGRYFSLARQLGQRTAEVHLLLGQESSNPAFAPEPFTSQHQQSIYQWSHVRIARTFETLRRRRERLGPVVGELLDTVLPAEKALDKLMRRITRTRIDAQRIRGHGDLHLGQVLFTGSDFVIIDFEGEPARPINERRFKRGALRDAMGMMRSFSYATQAALRSGRVRPEDAPRLGEWADCWTAWVSVAYLKSYLDTLGSSPLAPATDEVKDLLLEFYEIEKVIYEVEYELNTRPDWLRIPLAGLARIVGQHQG